jgi:hypothetical protein
VINVEAVARRVAAQKMGLVKDTHGLRLPDDPWRQMLPAAGAYLEDLAFEIYQEEETAALHSGG